MLSCFIIYWLIQYLSNSDRKMICLIHISVGSISLVFTYALLAPLVVGSTLIAICVHELTTVKSELRKKIIITICLITFVSAFVMIIVVALYLSAEGKAISLNSSINFFTQALKNDGYMYSRIYSDLLILFPAIIAVIIDIKNSNNRLAIFTLSYTIFVILCFILCFNEDISAYYYYKTYYIFWVIGWFCLGNWVLNSNLMRTI